MELFKETIHHSSRSKLMKECISYDLICGKASNVALQMQLVAVILFILIICRNCQ